MLEFLSVLLLGALVYLVWRVVDQLPDVVFRLGEIQRDISEMRRLQDRPTAVAPTANVGGPPPVPS